MAELIAGSDRADLLRIADLAQEQLDRAELSRPARRTVESLVTQVRRAATFHQALGAVDDTTAELDRLTAVIATLRQELEECQERSSRVEPFGTAWRDRLTLGVQKAAAEEAPRLWIRAYAQAFVAAEFKTCEWLSWSAELLADRDLARRMFTSARAAGAANLPASLPALEVLTESPLAAALPAELRLQAWCMRLRAIGRGLGDPPRARDLARGLVDASPPPDLPVTVAAALHTALGECLLASEDPEGAARECRRAVRTAPREPAGYVLHGLIAEAVGNVTRADEWYEDAAEAGGARAVAGELFAPVPPNLLWKYGRRIRDDDPQGAARAIRKALLLGIRGTGAYPDRKPYVDLGRALEKRPDRSVQAAEAFWEAGRRYAWLGDETSAQTYLEKACRLDPAEVRYLYERAEILRIRAVRDDGTVDLRCLGKAARAWRQAYELKPPHRDAPWAYLTMALIVHEESGDLYRPRASWQATAVLERALLARPGHPRVTAQLSQAHRLLGNRWTALELSTQALGLDRRDELVFDQHLLALMEVERDAEALRLLDRHGLTSDQPWLVNRKGQLLVALGRPREALELLDSATPSDPALHDLQIALCEHLLGRPAAAREAAQRVCDRQEKTGGGQRTYLYAHACYLVGDYDTAIGLYQHLVDDDPADAALRCDLGQALLARGDPATDDLARGRGHLLDGVATTRSVVALDHLLRVDLPWLLDLVADSGQHEAVRAAVEDVRPAVSRRRGQLVGAATSTDELTAAPAEDRDVRESTLAALARMDLTAGRTERALDRYADLAGGGDGWAEAAYGIEVAARRLQQAADRLASTRDQAGALEAYQRLLKALDGVPASAELVASTHLRAVLSAVELDRPEEFAAHVAAAFPPSLPAATVTRLRRGVSRLVNEPAQYWRVIDAMRTLRNQAVRDGAAAAAADTLVSGLDLASLLGAGSTDIDATELFPLPVPLNVRVDRRLLTPPTGPDAAFGELLSRLRAQVERDTGVFLPVIDAQPLDDEPPGSYRIELYEVPLAHGRVPLDRFFRPDPDPPGEQLDADGPHDPLTRRPGRWIDQPPEECADPDRPWTARQFVVRHLEAIIRASLTRMFSIDDVGLWLSAMPATGPEVGDADRLSRADRLELLRLLRLLLREQVPIIDRHEIFQVVVQAGPDWSAAALLPEVRRAIKHRLAPPEALDRPPAILPADLEASVAQGLSAPDGTWALGRADVQDICDRILAWRQTAAGPVVVLRDRRLRPFFWRLLTGLVPGPLWVLTREELP